ncbi:MAG: type II toxin-antitoxin system PemK/MazF family toxin [Microbacteriaceae bacterium]|nr:type II toxin-antitoxin system PemK/MazF family toxin [Microbacteriaceae bacterium]
MCRECSASTSSRSRRSWRNCGGSPVTRGVPWLTSSKQPCEATSRRKRSWTSRPRTSPPPSWPCCPSCPRSRALRGAARRPGPMRRAEVWWAELPPPVGPRPVVVLTRDAVCDTIGAVVVALVTRTSRGLPTEVSVGKPEGLPRPSVVNTDNILTVPRQRLARLMGQFSSAKIDELDRALKIALGLES